jgi:nucleotide-binding universal stress UspA family protein
MTTLIVATDGSDLAIQAAGAGLSLTKPVDEVLVVAVADLVDPSLAEDASGHAAASMTYEEVETNHREARAEGRAAVEATVESLRKKNPVDARLETRVIEGDPGPALCRLAADMGASALIIGSRGRGGIKRAFLGSVSRHRVARVVAAPGCEGCPLASA